METKKVKVGKGAEKSVDYKRCQEELSKHCNHLSENLRKEKEFNKYLLERNLWHRILNTKKSK